MILIISIFIIISIATAAVAIYGLNNTVENQKPKNTQINETQNNNNTQDTNQETHDFVFINMDNNEEKLSDHRGKIVILDLWATWCGPCKNQMFELIKTYNHYTHEDLEILSINIDKREDTNDIISFQNLFKENGYPLNWTFGMEKNENLEKYMPDGGIPTICVFDKDGNLVESQSGVAYFDEIPSNYPSYYPDPIVLKNEIDKIK